MVLQLAAALMFINELVTTEAGTDGLTDKERAEAAQRYTEATALTADQIAHAKRVLADIERDREWAEASQLDVAFAGDWHQNGGWAQSTLEAIPGNVHLIIHLGDFGLIYPHDTQLYLDRLDAVLTDRNMHMWVVPGNHEDWDWIDSIPTNTTGRQPIRNRISLLPRGHTFTLAHTSFCAIGGAVSIDRKYRKAGINYWKREAVTDEEADAIIASVPTIDVLLLHDMITGADTPAADPRDIRRYAGDNCWHDSEDHNLRLRRVADHLQPSYLLHGHMHARYSHLRSLTPKNSDVPYDVHIEGLACDEMDGNLIITRVSNHNVHILDEPYIHI